MMARMNMVYGIPNCDTVKRARVWLAGHDVPFQFHDFKNTAFRKLPWTDGWATSGGRRW